MAQVNMFEAKTRLSAYVQRALDGEEVIIAKAGKPLVQLKPVTAKKRRLGGWEGKVKVSKDFDSCGPEIEALFGLGSGE